MFKEEFLRLVSNAGMATLKDLRKLAANNKAKDVMGEFDLLNLSTFDDVKFAKLMSEKYSLNFVDLGKSQIPSEILSRLQKKIVFKYRLIPVQETKSKFIVTSFDPLSASHLKDCSDILNKPVDFVLTTVSSWKDLYERVRASVDELIDTVKEITGDEFAEHEVKAEDIGDDVVTYVNRILADSFIRKASDIHVEPYEKRFRIRFRMDGNLVEVSSPPKNMMHPIISRLKIMAKMDISEKRKPQDGRIKLSIGGNPIDFRVSSLPTLFGEKIVLRLLDSSNLNLDLTKLGFLKRQLKVFEGGIKKPYGMCLVTGPTGSGKTTTLYSALSDLNNSNTNISSAEDPVEFNLEGINQVNVRKDIGLTFAAALKSFLRQDPDIIMVGEIRDLEVGEIAVEAALTGHLVLSTLHTNDAPSTVTRLLNMGIEPFLVVAALNVIVAQRLCKMVCPHCKTEDPGRIEELIQCGFTPESAKKVKAFRGKGCPECNGSGYKGRVAIHEVLPMTSKLKELILHNASAEEIKKWAIYEGMRTLRMSALIKVAEGLTTIEEAIANSASDNF